MLFERLQVPSPQMRAMPMEEWLRMIDALADVSFTQPGAGDHLQSRGKQRSAMLMEYTTGVG